MQPNANGPTRVEKSVAEQSSSASLLEQLGSSPAGLDTTKVLERRAVYGPNVLTRDLPTAPAVLLRQFRSPLVYFLGVAAVLAFATGDVSDGAIIVAILLINGGLGFSQEYRSEQAVERLANLISSKVAVRRDGATGAIDTAELVPGDIALLKEGDVVPADMKLLRATDVQVDESQLTGESIQVAKAPQNGGATARDASLLFTGSVVESGELTGIVYATGNDTAFGHIAALSRRIRKVTQYEKTMRSFSLLLIRVVIVSLAITVVVKLALNHGAQPVIPLFVFVIALAVSVVPEALPVISTLTLARGAVKMAKENVVVKRLSSLEDLGDVTLLCTDKTGTLTEGKLTITHLVSSDAVLLQTLVAATREPSSTGQEGTQAGFDAAFDAFIPEAIKQQARGFTIADEVPFDPAARRRRVLLSRGDRGEQVLVVIGSPETLLDISSSADRQHYLEQIGNEGRQGMRHLGVAYRPVGGGDAADVLALERDLTFLGYVALSDPLRKGTAETIASARALGVSIKILTGDSPDVAGYVAGQIGLSADDAPVCSGEDLMKLPHDALADAARRSDTFARVSPEQKYDLIDALKRFEVVGYEGDGINDAPSLKLADVGIAVDSATDVAKASADIILLDKRLAVIVNGIQRGREIFTNINKYIVYTLVGNFGNFLALSVLYLAAVSLPLLPRQLLLISLLTDVPLIAISTDSVESTDTSRPSKSDSRQLLSMSLVLGGLTAVAELLFFLRVHHDAVAVSRTALYLFLCFTQLIVIFSVRNRDHFWKANRPSWPLLAAVTAAGVLALAIPYVPPLAHLFSFSAPSLTELEVMVVGLALYFTALDLVKVHYYRLLHRIERRR